ncbi:hypothetical protein V7247_29905 [Priestia megaterium]|uniref:hypothetical protein n=1 Tax=Priestia megaterium TaxID=1404 RepID=UPI002FFF3405
MKNLITAKMKLKSSELKVGQTIKLDTAKNTHPSTPQKKKLEYKFPLSSGLLKTKSTDKTAINQFHNALSVISFKYGAIDNVAQRVAITCLQKAYLSY